MSRMLEFRFHKLNVILPLLIGSNRGLSLYLIFNFSVRAMSVLLGFQVILVVRLNWPWERLSLLIHILDSPMSSESLDSGQSIFFISHRVFETCENSTVKYCTVSKKFIFQLLSMYNSRLHTYVLIYDICVSLSDFSLYGSL